MGYFGSAVLKVILLSCFVLLTKSANVNRERDFEAVKDMTLSELLSRESSQGKLSSLQSLPVKHHSDWYSDQNEDKENQDNVNTELRTMPDASAMMCFLKTVVFSLLDFEAKLPIVQYKANFIMDILDALGIQRC